jgi:hypothetical protein
LAGGLAGIGNARDCFAGIAIVAAIHASVALTSSVITSLGAKGRNTLPNLTLFIISTLIIILASRRLSSHTKGGSSCRNGGGGDEGQGVDGDLHGAECLLCIELQIIGNENEGKENESKQKAAK